MSGKNLSFAMIKEIKKFVRMLDLYSSSCWILFVNTCFTLSSNVGLKYHTCMICKFGNSKTCILPYKLVHNPSILSILVEFVFHNIIVLDDRVIILCDPLLYPIPLQLRFLAWLPYIPLCRCQKAVLYLKCPQPQNIFLA